ncbi:MAG: hydrogenase maturation protease [Sulfuricella denitrificans]|nr:hydrogenase maturation protease [Sulfuricella denitrificans]
MTAPLLIFACGNPSRGDDALGPLLLERLAAMNLPGVELLTDFQLQVEHAIDLQGRERALFVDASVSCPPPFELSRLNAVKDRSFTSHAMSPAAVLQACQELYGAAPPAWLLAVRGESFELGEPLSVAAAGNLEAAFAQLQKLIFSNGEDVWKVG